MMGRTDAWQINCVPVRTHRISTTPSMQANTINCSLHFEFLAHIKSCALHQNRWRRTNIVCCMANGEVKWSELFCPRVGRINSNLFHSSLATAPNDCIASGVAVAATSSSFAYRYFLLHRIASIVISLKLCPWIRYQQDDDEEKGGKSKSKKKNNFFK